MRWHPRLDAAPPPLPAGPALADRIEGMLLGLAIGDALGNPAESLTAAERRARHGWIDHYLPNPDAGGRCVGLPSDDTQLAFRALAQALADGQLVPEALGRAIAGAPIFGIGPSTAAFCERFRAGLPWQRCGSPRASNGALMRIAPTLLPFVARPGPALWHDTLRSANLTHDDALSNASCIALVASLWQLLGRAAPPPAAQWVDDWLQIYDDLGLEARFVWGGAPVADAAAPATPPAVGCASPAGPARTLQALLRDELRPALAAGLSTADACARWGSSLDLHETVPSLLFILTRHAGDPRAAILEAVNHTFDNDTIGAVVGSAVGALHGASALPEAWVDDLVGRTAEDDDHRVFELMRDAAARFGYGVGPVLARQLARRGLG